MSDDHDHQDDGGQAADDGAGQAGPAVVTPPAVTRDGRHWPAGRP